MHHADDTQFTLRIPPDLHAELSKLAQEEQRSLNSLLIALLRDAIDTWHNDTRQRVIDRWEDTNQPPT